MSELNNPRDGSVASLEFLSNPEFVSAMKGYSGWGKFIAIMSYLSGSFVILGGLIYLLMGFSALASVSKMSFIGLFIIIYSLAMIFLGVMMIVYTIKLWKSTEKVASFKNSFSAEDYIQKSASNISLMRSYFKLMSITMIVYIVLVVFMTLGFFIVSLLSLSNYTNVQHNSITNESKYGYGLATSSNQILIFPS